MSEEIKAAAVTTVVPLEEKTPAVLYDDEIATVEGLEGAERTAAKEAFQGEHEFTEEEYKRLVRKVDWVLLPLMWWLYGIQQTDKLGLSTMNLFGLQQDTHMHGGQYAFLNVLFYLSYGIFEFPSMAFLQRYNVGKALTIYVFLWGVVVFVQGFFTDYAQFAAFRFLQGLFECTISPGFNFIIAQWYTVREHSSRSLVFQSANAGWGIIVNSVFYGIAKYAEHHPGSFAAWRGISLFLGAQTLIAAVVSWFVLGTPNEVRWLTHREKVMANARIMKNHTGTDLTGKKKFDWAQVKEAFMDPVLYFQFANTFLACVPNGALTTFGSILNTSFGFNKYQVTLLTLPRDAFSVLWFVAVGWTSLKFKNVRLAWMVVSTLIPMTSFLVIALLPVESKYKAAKMVMYILTTTFTIPTFSAWALISSNTAGKTKFTVMMTTTFIAFCTGNIAGAEVLDPKTAPSYKPGVTAVAICMAVEAAVILVWAWWLVYQNRKKRAGIAAEGLTQEQVERRAQELGAQDVTDMKNPYFLYAL